MPRRTSPWRSPARALAPLLVCTLITASLPARGEPTPTPAPAASSEPAAAPAPATEQVSVETEAAPTGMGANVISAADPEAKRARSDLEGTTIAGPDLNLPQRLQPLQRGAWWSLFGAFALASAGGVFAGLAEVQEDRARRLATGIDLQGGGQSLYADKQAEYEDLLATGERQQNLARGLLIGGGVALAAALALFAVHGAREAKKQPRARARLGVSGLEVAF